MSLSARVAALEKLRAKDKATGIFIVYMGPEDDEKLRNAEIEARATDQLLTVMRVVFIDAPEWPPDPAI